MVHYEKGDLLTPHMAIVLDAFAGPAFPRPEDTDEAWGKIRLRDDPRRTPLGMFHIAERGDMTLGAYIQKGRGYREEGMELGCLLFVTCCLLLVVCWQIPASLCVHRRP